MMSSPLSRFLAAVAAVAFLFNTASTNAAMMNFGTFVGDNVTFVDVTESNLDAELHYSSVAVLSDTLILDPVGFGVQVNPGPGAELIDSELEMMITANDGAQLLTVSYSEQGDYTLAGDAEVTAGLQYFWAILEVDGAAITPINGNGQSDFSANVAATGELWALGFDINLAAELTEAGGDGAITKINLRFDNSLTANAADASSVAFIKKKQVDGLTVVPEPSSCLVMLIGLGTLLCRRRSF